MLIGFLISPVINAQFDKEEFEYMTWKEKVFFGGSFGIMFGTYTDIEVSPIVGYRITRHLSLAVGPKYRYYREKIIYQSQPYSLEGHVYGGRSYVQFYFIKNINDFIPIGIHAGFFAHAEYELLSLEEEDFRPQYGNRGRYLLHTAFVGPGLRLPAGRRAAVNFMVLWNLNENSDSPYTSPIIRFGFTF